VRRQNAKLPTAVNDLRSRDSLQAHCARGMRSKKLDMHAGHFGAGQFRWVCYAWELSIHALLSMLMTCLDP
jgi:hypothetical protein